VWQLIGKWTEAETLYKQALALAEQAGDIRGRAQSQLLLGHFMWYRANYPEALNWLEKARTDFETLNDRHGLSQAIGRMGLVYRMQSEYDLAKQHFELQIQLANEHHDEEGLAEAIGHLGNVYRDRREYASALECYEQELKIATAIGNRRESLYAIGNMGNVYDELGDSAKGIVNMGQALDVALEIGDNYTAALVALNLGETYRLKGNYAEALSCYQYCVKSALELDERVAISCALANMGQVYLAQLQLAQAESLLTKAISLTRSLNTPYYLAEFLYSQAELLSQSDNLTESYQVNMEVLEVAQKAERKDILLKAKLLDIGLLKSFDKVDIDQVNEMIESIKKDFTDDAEQAAIEYKIWQLTNNTEARDKAIELYRRCYIAIPNIEYYDHLRQLTSEHIEPPPELPTLPIIIEQTQIDLEALSSQLDMLLTTL
jgi:tetratricopeptide (TPR) repeat protein